MINVRTTQVVALEFCLGLMPISRSSLWTYYSLSLIF